MEMKGEYEMFLKDLNVKLLSLSDRCSNFIMKSKALLCLSSVWLVQRYSTVVCFAKGTEKSGGSGDSPADFLKGKGNGAFGSVQTTVEETGASLYNLIITFSVICLVLGLVSIGIGFAFGSGKQKDESKSKLIFWIIGAILIFGCLSLVGYAKYIGSSI